MAKEKKNQHYVPQAYLRNFCIHGTEQVHVWERTTGKKFKASIRNVAAERYFYDFDGDEVFAELGDQPVETFFSMVERAFVGHLGVLLRNVDRFGGFSEQNKKVFSQYIFFQWCRTPQFREEMDASLKQTAVEQMKAKLQAGLVEVPANLKGLTLEEMFKKVDFKYEPGSYAHFMVSREESIRKHIESLMWNVGINETPLPLVTSDAPVRPYVNSVGAGSWIFPLTSKHLLMLDPPPAGETGGGGTWTLDLDGVAFFNRVQMDGCRRQCYGSDDYWDVLASLHYPN